MRFVALLMLALPLSAQLSVRAGLGADSTRATTVTDRDCSATNPPALFGCVNGGDGERLAARGDFGRTNVLELGAGYDLSTNARIELLLQHRNDLELDAAANFPNVTGEQPVSADTQSNAAFLTGTWLFGTSPDVRPFLTAGLGASRNEIDAVTFAFPGIAPDAVTVIRGGTNTNLAYLLGAGLTITLTNHLDADLGIRYTNLGAMTTDPGPATIVRPRGTTVIDIAGVESDLTALGVNVSLRYRFR